MPGAGVEPSGVGVVLSLSFSPGIRIFWPIRSRLASRPGFAFRIALAVMRCPNMLAACAMLARLSPAWIT